MSREPSVEAMNYRRALREARAVIAEYQEQLLLPWLRNRLVDVDAFEIYVGRANVIDRAGRIDWAETELRVRNLIDQRPYLAAVGASEHPDAGAVEYRVARPEPL